MPDVELTDAPRAWIAEVEPVWRRAHEIVAQHPGLDVGDVFHVLRNLERSLSERLRRALRHGRAPSNRG